MKILHLVQSASAEPPNTPVWFNEHGMTMRVQAPNAITPSDADVLIGKGVIASLSIKQVGKRPKYIVSWCIAHAGGIDNPHTSGRIECDPRELRRMFCLTDSVGDPDSDWLIQRYGGTTATRGKFIRWGQYLNVPGPGTGHDGDANISVFVSEQIRKEVLGMLAKHGNHTWDRVAL